ncbi:MAG: rRNA maturation RNase YbeY [Verrucomicrobia bacterium]|nr:rRNA maturation RNase YbeY [Verrucomicrobiota bacterium]
MAREVQVGQRRRGVSVSPASVERVVHALDRSRLRRCPAGSLSVAFIGDREIARLHADFLDDPSVTDVITFPGEPHPAEPFAGEICINVDQARRAAREHGQSLAEELRLYLVHGWLHLAGLDDGTPRQVAAMRAAERKALTSLDRKGLWLRVKE